MVLYVRYNYSWDLDSQPRRNVDRCDPDQTNQEKTLNFLFCELNNVYYFFWKVVRLIFYSLKVVFCLLTIQQTQLYILLIYFGNIPSINSVCSDQLNK